MFYKRITLLFLFGLLFFSLLLVSCQTETNGEMNTAQDIAETSTIEPTATLEPARPEPQSGPDTDGDWVSDADEEKFGTDPEKWDTDEDGSTDFEEIFIVGSDPVTFDGDSDEDWMRDVTEELVGSDPNSPDDDRDGDGISDLMELKLGSDPGKMDTDGDLLSDFLELFLTETDPAVADPLNEYGFPQSLEAWLPEQLQNVNCEAATIFTIDEMYVPNPEEADSPSDIIPGDDVYVKYALWIDASPDANLSIENNTDHTAVWSGKAFQDTLLTRDDFRTLNPVFTKCGQSVTVGLQALEDDSPFGGIWDMGTWRDDVHLVFNRIPFGWGHSFQDGVRFSGTTHDSDYEYDFIYSFAVQLLSNEMSRNDVVSDFETHFNNGTASTTASNQENMQNIILTGMLLSLLDSSAGSTYQPDGDACNTGYELDGRCVSAGEYQLAGHKSN